MRTRTADDDIEIRGFAVRLAWVVRSLTAGGLPERGEAESEGCPERGEAESKGRARGWHVCAVSDGLGPEVDRIRRHMHANQSLRLGIVDDDDGARSAVARLLRCLGHEVRPFESAEAIEAADVAGLALDCLIVDVRLPGVSGPELRDRLRAQGHADAGRVHHRRRRRQDPRRRAALTVVKPFDGETLLAAVDAAISAAHGSDVRHVR